MLGGLRAKARTEGGGTKVLRGASRTGRTGIVACRCGWDGISVGCVARTLRLIFWKALRWSGRFPFGPTPKDRFLAPGLTSLYKAAST